MTQQLFESDRARRGEELILEKLQALYPDDWKTCLDAGPMLRMAINEPARAEGLCIDVRGVQEVERVG